MISTNDILARVQTAFSNDAVLKAAVVSAFGAGSVLVIQVGGDPVHEVTAQDCPMIALLNAGPNETGRQSSTWRWPIELQLFVTSDGITIDASAPAGTKLVTVTGPALLDTFAKAVRAALLRALDTLQLLEEALKTDVEAPLAAAWPRQRAVISLTVALDTCIGVDPVLPSVVR